MPNNDLSIKDRLHDAVRMGQEPIDRLWAAVYVLIAIVLLAGGLTIYYAETQATFLETSRALDFERGALVCQQVIVDNERTSGLPAYCGRVEVRAYLPPEACEEFLPDVSDCGSKWDEV